MCGAVRFDICGPICSVGGFVASISFALLYILLIVLTRDGDYQAQRTVESFPSSLRSKNAMIVNP